MSDPSSNLSDRPSGRVAGIDYGTVRIGIALTDAGRTIASPVETYARSGPEADSRRFRKLAADERVTLFVVGLPVHGDGSDSAASVAARGFGKWLGETTGVPVEFFDERYTTVEAEALLLDADLTRKQRKQRRDRLAAQLLLAAWLESSTRGQQRPGPLEG